MKRKLLAVSVICIILCSCAAFNQSLKEGDFTSNAYKTLNTMAVTYDAVMQSSADLYKQGKISEHTKGNIAKYGLKFWQSYHIAVEALVAYKKTEAEEDKTRIMTAIESASNFLSYINMYLEPKA